MTAEEIFCDLFDKYGEDFNWYMVPDYSCAMKSRFRKSGNQITGRRKSSLASLLA